MKTREIDRICTATLQGRVGPVLMSPKAVREFTCALTGPVDGTATLRNATVWTTAVPGSSKGSC